jgi:hypothetical protein
MKTWLLPIRQEIEVFMSLLSKGIKSMFSWCVWAFLLILLILRQAVQVFYK